MLLKSFGKVENLYLGEAATPKINASEVLIKVHAAGLNRADILQRKGFYPPPQGASEILGLEVAGEIAEAGEDSSAVRGERVMALLSGGGYAQFASIHHGLVLPLPSDMEYSGAAGVMEAYLTAFQAMHWLSELQPAERILIHAGASGVGTAAIQLAKISKAKIWVTASASKHQLCYDLGAHHCIDYRKEDFQQVLQDQGGMNVIMDFIGAPYFPKNLQVLALDGRMVMQGFMGGTELSSLNLSPILGKRLKIMGSTLRSRSLSYRCALVADFKKRYWDKLQDGSLRPIIDRIFPWNEVRQAHEYMETNSNQGKIILKVDQK